MSNNETFRTHLMPSCLVPGPVGVLESAHEALGDALLALPAPAPVMSCLSPGLTTLPPAGVSTQAPTAPAPTPFGLCDSSSSAEGPGERASGRVASRCRFYCGPVALVHFGLFLTSPDRLRVFLHFSSVPRIQASINMDLLFSS